MILLSYTTLSNYHAASHTYLCKAAGIETPETEAMTKGKEAHAKLQAHLLGKEKLPIDLDWDITKAECHGRKKWDEQFTLHGYADGINYRSKVMVEIKTGSPWSQQKFYDSMQPKYYSWIFGLSKFLFITCRFDLSQLKTYYKEMTTDDWKGAEVWATEAIEGIKAGEFKGGLENGHCTGCPYGERCLFV